MPHPSSRSGVTAVARAAALAAPRAWRQPGWPLGWRSSLARWLAEEAEQRRLFPLLAVSFGLGVLLSFMADGRPALWAPVLGAVLAAGAAGLARSKPFAFGVAVGLCAAFSGFAASVLRERSISAPVLARAAVGPLTGFIEAVEERGEGGRLVIRLASFADLTEERRPRRVRVVAGRSRGLKPGDFIASRARLLPLPEAAWPGGYDFGRDAYFRGIGAVGTLLGSVEVRPPPAPPPLDLAAAAAIDAARNALTRRIAEGIGGSAGAVAAALVTGKRGLIDEPTNDILRGAGIYHIVSISGLHMVLAAGTFFALARALLALSPFAALCWPIKKIAALVAMAGAFSYCVFSGAEVATERSLVMVLVMFGAILVDRPALSLRNLAIAALVVLLREPETLLGPSFQMSFAAVAALIAAAEWERRRRPVDEELGPWARVRFFLRRAMIGLFATTLVASIATAPFGAYHFHTLNTLGLIGNALALPLVSLVVMPFGVLGMLALPFGLDGWAWQVMGYAVGKVLVVSAWVSSLKGSTVPVPAFGSGALALMTAGLLVATLFVSPLRWLALAPALLGLWLASSPVRYDVFVDRTGQGAAVRDGSGSLVILGRPSTFTVEQWLKADGDPRRPDDETLRRSARCDSLGCTALARDGRFIALVRDRRAFPEDCARAAVIVTPLPAPAFCQSPTIIDSAHLAAAGATALRFVDGALPAVTTARSPRHAAAWQPQARPRPQAPPAPAEPRSTAPPDEAPEGFQ